MKLICIVDKNDVQRLAIKQGIRGCLTPRRIVPHWMEFAGGEEARDGIFGMNPNDSLGVLLVDIHSATERAGLDLAIRLRETGFARPIILTLPHEADDELRDIASRQSLLLARCARPSDVPVVAARASILYAPL